MKLEEKYNQPTNHNWGKVQTDWNINNQPTKSIIETGGKGPSLFDSTTSEIISSLMGIDYSRPHVVLPVLKISLHW